MSGPLTGLKVDEVGVAMDGPFCGMMLADYGADVVKIERVGIGDDSRQWPALFSRRTRALLRFRQSQQGEPGGRPQDAGWAAGRTALDAAGGYRDRQLPHRRARARRARLRRVGAGTIRG
ncbi:MAG: CoA transferase [Acetobacteraceae bacterium]